MYSSLSFARAEGITSQMADDARLTSLLTRESRRIDDLTGWWFESRALTLTLDGSGARHLHLPAPAITITRVAVDDTDLDLADVLNIGKPTGLSTERWNPKLLRAGGYAWPRGTRNITVVGTFGFVEADGTVPLPIQEACVRLVVRSLPLLANAAGQEDRRRTLITKETTDGHSYELGQGEIGRRAAWRFSGATGDPEIDVVLARYRCPPAGGVV